jgi:hypothetical protein
MYSTSVRTIRMSEVEEGIVSGLDQKLDRNKKCQFVFLNESRTPCLLREHSSTQPCPQVFPAPLKCFQNLI